MVSIPTTANKIGKIMCYPAYLYFSCMSWFWNYLSILQVVIVDGRNDENAAQEDEQLEKLNKESEETAQMNE